MCSPGHITEQLQTLIMLMILTYYLQCIAFLSTPTSSCFVQNGLSSTSLTTPNGPIDGFSQGSREGASQDSTGPPLSSSSGYAHSGSGRKKVSAPPNMQPHLVSTIIGISAISAFANSSKLTKKRGSVLCRCALFRMLNGIGNFFLL